MNTFQRVLRFMAATMTVVSILVGCASVKVHKVPTPTQYQENGRSTWTRADQVRADAMEGVRFYLPRPFVSVFESFPIATDLYLAQGRVSADGKNIRIESVRPITTRAEISDSSPAIKLVEANIPTTMVFASHATGAPGASGTGPGRSPISPQSADALDLITSAASQTDAAAQRSDAAAKEAAAAATAANQAAANAATTSTTEAAQTGINQRKVTNNNGAFAYQPLRGNFDLVYIPDFDEQYVITSHAGLGQAKFELNLGQGWSLQGLDSLSDNSELNKRIFDLIDTSIAMAKTAAKAYFPLLNAPAAMAGLATPQAGDALADEKVQGVEVTLKIVVVHYAAKGLYPVIKPRELFDRAAPGLTINLSDGNGRAIPITDEQIRAAAEAFDRHQRRFTAPVYPYQYISFNTFRYMAIEAVSPDGNPFGTLYDKTGTVGDAGDRQAADLAEFLRRGIENVPEKLVTDPALALKTVANKEVLTAIKGVAGAGSIEAIDSAELTGANGNDLKLIARLSKGSPAITDQTITKNAAEAAKTAINKVLADSKNDLSKVLKIPSVEQVRVDFSAVP